MEATINAANAPMGRLEELMEKIHGQLERMRLDNIRLKKQAWTVSDVAEILGVSESRVYTLCSQRKLPHYKRGTQSYFDPQEVWQWQLSHKVKTQEEVESEAETLLAVRRLGKGAATTRKAKAC